MDRHDDGIKRTLEIFSVEPDSSYLKGDLLETLLDIVCYAA